MSRRIENIIVHWSASGKKTTIADIKRWHLKAGMRDIGYHRVILHPDSINEISILKWADLVKKGRPINDDKWLEDWEKGAHTLYHNQNTYGICVVGNVDYPLHPLQSEALINTLGITLKRLELPRSAVKGHKDFNPTQCPGPHVYKLLGDFKQKINA